MSEHDEHFSERRHEDRVLEALRGLSEAQRESARSLSGQIAQVQVEVREGARASSEMAKDHVRLEERLKGAEAKVADLELRMRPLEQQGARVAAIAGAVALLIAGVVEAIVSMFAKH